MNHPNFRLMLLVVNNTAWSVNPSLISLFPKPTVSENSPLPNRLWTREDVRRIERLSPVVWKRSPLHFRINQRLQREKFSNSQRALEKRFGTTGRTSNTLSMRWDLDFSWKERIKGIPKGKGTPIEGREKDWPRSANSWDECFVGWAWIQTSPTFCFLLFQQKTLVRLQNWSLLSHFYKEYWI